jgi:hypothetical protein
LPSKLALGEIWLNGTTIRARTGGMVNFSNFRF